MRCFVNGGPGSECPADVMEHGQCEAPPKPAPRHRSPAMSGVVVVLDRSNVFSRPEFPTVERASAALSVAGSPSVRARDRVSAPAPGPSRLKKRSRHVPAPALNAVPPRLVVTTSRKPRQLRRPSANRPRYFDEQCAPVSLSALWGLLRPTERARTVGRYGRRPFAS